MPQAAQDLTIKPPADDERPDRTAVAEYAAAMCADMVMMARGHKLDTLAYLLDMARLEAENLARNGNPPG
jgi:hypothetical protein